MGGLITMTLALRRLGLIGAAVLNDVGPSISMRGLQRIAGYVGHGEPFRGWDEAAEYARTINGCAFPHYTGQDWDTWARRACAEVEPGKIAMRYDPNIAVAVRAGKIKTSSLAARFAFRRLARKRPTLLLHGALSDLVEPEQVALMRSMAPGLSVTMVPGVGHAPMLNEPAARGAIQDFLARID
jgi:pimeloyl-ACP methyl ester carboxylesterase